MRIVLFSSVFNHHSLPFCDAMSQLCNGEFYFVETMQEEEQRKALGYHSYERDYVINSLASEDNARRAKELSLNADVMIASVFPYELLKERLKLNKLTFLCQERIFKGGASLARWFQAWFFNVRKYLRFKNAPLFFLSIGKGAAADYRSIGFYTNKSFLWGYYPPFSAQDVSSLLEEKHSESVNILFAGRLISLKHPEYSLRAVQKLLQKGYDVKLTYVGCGEMEEWLRSQAEGMDAVSFVGSVSPEDVRTYMNKADILTFTSNSLEGWGAVVNEAMNSACAVVASNSAGAVSTLIDDGINGMVYYNDDFNEFYEKLEALVANRERARTMGINAYNTIANRFNAKIAAERFFALSQSLLNGERPEEYSDGILKKL